MVEELFAYFFGIYTKFGYNNPSILITLDSVDVELLCLHLGCMKMIMLFQEIFYPIMFQLVILSVQPHV